MDATCPIQAARERIIKEEDCSFLTTLTTSFASKVITKRFLVRLGRMSWWPGRLTWGFVNCKEKQNFFATLLSYYTGDVQALLKVLQEQRLVHWVISLLQARKDEVFHLHNGYLFYVMKRYPMHFEHCVPYIQAKDMEKLLAIAIKNHHAKSLLWMSQNPFFDAGTALCIHCNYHKLRSSNLSIEKQKEYWNLTKVDAFALIIEILFRQCIVISREILDVFPPVLMLLERLSGEGKNLNTGNSPANIWYGGGYKQLAFPVQFSDIAWKTSRWQTLYIPLSLTVLDVLAHGSESLLLQETIFNKYKKEIQAQFRANNPYIKNICFSLKDFCWQNYYRYLCRFYILPVELRVLIANFMW